MCLFQGRAGETESIAGLRGCLEDAIFGQNKILSEVGFYVIVEKMKCKKAVPRL